MRKELLIEEMKRAIKIMESKEDLKRTITIEDGRFPWEQTDRDVVELFQLLKMIRKHSTKLERGMVSSEYKVDHGSYELREIGKVD